MEERGINRSSLKKKHAEVYERHVLSDAERKRVQSSADGIRKKIVQFFEEFPDGKISPSEFKDLMGLNNPIHGVRPRFTDLKKEGWLQEVNGDKVPSGYGGDEHRYMRASENGQMRLL